MSRSISPPTVEARRAQAGPGWAVAWNGTALRHRAANEERTMEWAVGSGHEGKSYLVRIGDGLFQSPLSWYSRRGAWDLSPGFARDQAFDFFRPVTNDCLFCHAGRAAPVPGTLNQYVRNDPIPEPAIGCARCHGNGAAHAQDGRRGNIVNPSKLPPRERDSVCEQCHLSGVARVPNPGRTFADFQPGMALEDVFSVYVLAGAQDFKVVSHSEQLALSKCAVASRTKLWCASCHDPHREPADAPRWYQAKCEGCHANARPHGDACTDCHMPKASAHDGSHTVFTDHRIQRPGEPARTKAGRDLRPWREPAEPLRARGLGLAYVGTGEWEKGYALLRDVSQDAEVQAALGLLFLRSGRPSLAVNVLERAAKEQPKSSTRLLNLAAAWLAAGQPGRAKAEALRAIEMEPLLRDAYVLLAEIEPRRAGYWKGEFAKRMRR